jgi:hydrogenase 3 maturation protease
MMIEILRNRLSGKKVAILGVGNPLRGDDAFGPNLVDRLQGKVNAILINAGDVPENYLGKLIELEPEVVIIVDVADFDAEPGDIAVLEIDDIHDGGLTTHNASLNLVAKFLQYFMPVDVLLLGVKPASTTFGAPMTPVVADSLRLIEQILVECCEMGDSIRLEEHCLTLAQ